MLEDINILMLGGDARYLYVIQYLTEQNAQLSVLGFDEHTFSDEKINIVNEQTIDFSIYDAVILPITGVGSTGEIVPTFSKQTYFLTADHLKQTKANCIIFTGVMNHFLQQITERTNRQLVALFNRNNVAILNSIPTAEATLKLAIEHTNYTIHRANVFVLGFGRIGFTTARLFKNVGAHVTVVARDDSHLARITEMNMTPLHLDDLATELHEAEIIINTIPHLILTRKMVKLMNQNSLIIDLASTPGGTNFSAAKDYNIQALHALGLPGKTAPKTAGIILGETVTNLLQSPVSND